ncbi:MAG: hypothetical protein M9936_20955 [Caldilinea sp.]|nr:hypothetical protein [Caldilineaceae bacterium]MCB9121778.1 hypothetical protein [Caldilineaceae bacterium]MCB9123107.1 hypothetical protein [Caldilineaceae bacterium]MCO5212172.1 hypothetical protein [Caldilinea sp.]MCW5844817.1 hypothetical protein [Caldilinea sp.]
MISRRLVLCVVLMLAMFMGAGCLDDDFLRYRGPCERPDDVELSQVIGVWQANYREFLNPDSPSSRISGVETLTIHADGTYSQLFESAEYNYSSPMNRWSLILNEGDGVKLQMEGLRYFANGLDYVDGPLNLSLQTPDRLAYKESVPDIADRKAKIVVNYPEDGFVYLYPRSCIRKFVLLQMVSGGGDPDNLTVHNPVFTKVE